MPLRLGVSRQVQALAAAIAALLALAIIATTTLAGGGRTVSFQPGQRITFSAAQMHEWSALTNTPAQRAQIVSELQTAFAGVAQVGMGALPASPNTGTRLVQNANYTGGATAQPALAVGVNNHFWVTMSYADIISGGIRTAQIICGRYLPGFVCGALANVLRWVASGYTYWTGAHGVWGAAYWSGYTTGGRW